VGSGARAAAHGAVIGAPKVLVTVRHAVGTDLESVAAIERVSFSDPWSVESLASALSLPHGRFFVVEHGEGTRAGGGGAPVLLGYVVALLYGEEGEIADLAVAQTARRRGIGGVLLDRVLAEAMESGVRALYLEVRESNSAAGGPGPVPRVRHGGTPARLLPKAARGRPGTAARSGAGLR
jgi:ribosomal-protein-alanine N-acetyltransferase